MGEGKLAMAKLDADMQSLVRRSAPSANHTIIRVGLIGVGNWALNGPVRVLSLMPQYEMAAVYSQRRDAAQSASDTFGIRHVVGSIDELVRHPDRDIVLVLPTRPQHEGTVRAAIAAAKAVDLGSPW